jgi:hypothetical protein
MRRRNGVLASKSPPQMPVFKDMTRLLHIIRRRSLKAGVGMNGNGHPHRGPSEEERQVLAKEVRRFEQALRELAKT